MTPDEITAALKRGWELGEETKRIVALECEVLDPVCDYATELSTDKLRELISRMPPGFHRSELRAILKEKRETND